MAQRPSSIRRWMDVVFMGLSLVAKAAGGRLFMAWNAAAPWTLCAWQEKIMTLAGGPLFSCSIQPHS